MNKTPIEWTDFSANPLKYRSAAGEVVWGCAKVSAGCTNCYSEALAHRYGRGGPFNAGVMAGLTPFLDEQELRRMLTYKPAAGKRCFVGDMTDVFGEWVPDELIDRLFAVFALRPDVTWQVLTKRPERMPAYFAAAGVLSRIADQAQQIFTTASIGSLNAFRIYPIGPSAEFGHRWFVEPFPLPNVWLGTSVEDQKAADERIPQLLQTPAAVRFISVEPLLGSVEAKRFFRKLLFYCNRCGQEKRRDYCAKCGTVDNTPTNEFPGLDWVIIGGESGPGARPCDISHVSSVVDQCRAASVPVFVKQLGSEPQLPGPLGGHFPGHAWRVTAASGGVAIVFKSRKGSDRSEWPEALRVQQFPGGAA